MQLNECIKIYLDSLKATSSPGNYDFVQSNLAMVKSFFDKNGYSLTTEVKLFTMYEIIDHFKKRGNISNSINKKIGCLKRMLKHSNISIPGVTDFPKISFKRQSFHVLNDIELQKACAYFSALTKTPHNLTKSLLFWIFLYTGARLSEVLNIRINDVDFESHSIYLTHTKTNEPRTVFFNSRIDDDLKFYIYLKQRDLLFWNFKGNYDRPLNQDNVEGIFENAKKHLKFDKFSPHVLRHTMATLLVEQDAPINSIKEILGHRSLITTQIYLHMSIRKLKTDYDKYFPDMVNQNDKS